MKAPFSFAPAFPAAVGIVAGILVGGTALWLAASIVGAALFTLLYFKGRHYFSFFFLAFCAGALLAYSSRPDCFREGMERYDASIVAKALTVSPSSDGYACLVEIDSVDGQPYPHVLGSLRIRKWTPDIQSGATLRFNGGIYAYSSDDLLPYETDPNLYYKNQGAICAVSLRDGEPVICDPTTVASMQRAIFNMRNAIFNAIVTAPVDASTSAFLVAAILGDREFLSDNVTDSFRITGVSHVLALSGLHVGIIVSILGLMLFPLRFHRRGKMAASIICILLIWTYACIVGMPASVMRASVMITLLLFSNLLQRDPHPFNSLCMATVVVLAFDPRSLYTAGFQMSFCAVATILLCNTLIPESLKKRPVLNFIVTAVTLPVAAMLGTGIISAFYFSSVPVLFVISNIAVGILFPWVIGGGVALMLLNIIGVQFYLLGNVVDVLMGCMTSIVEWLSSLSFASINEVCFSPWAFLSYACFIIVLAALVVNLKYVIFPKANVLLGCIAISALLVTAMVSLWVKDAAPVAELHIPARQSGAMMLCSGGCATVYKLDNGQNDEDILRDFNNRFKRFLLNRGYGASFIVCDSAKSMGSIKVVKDHVVIGDAVIRMIGAGQLPRYEGIDVKYAMVKKDFTGNVEDIIALTHPDTILILPGMHHLRAKKLIGQCGDSVPIRQVKGKFSIYVP